MLNAGAAHSHSIVWRLGSRRSSLLLLAFALLVVLATSAASGVEIDQELVVEDVVEWTGETHNVHANVTIADGGTLNVTGITLNFISPPTYPIGLIVEAGGSLLIEDCVLRAADVSYFITSDGDLALRSTDLSGLYSQIPFNRSYEELVGGIVANDGTVELRDVGITNSNIHMTVYDATVDIDGLDLTGGEYGLIFIDATGTVANLTVTETALAILLGQSELAFTDVTLSDVNWSLMAQECDLTIKRMTSQADGSHLVHENGTMVVEDSTFIGGEEAVMAFLGYVEVTGCTFSNNTNSIELLYAEGKIRQVVIEDAWDVAIVLNSVGFETDTFVFEFHDVTVRNGYEQAIDIEGCSDLVLTNILIEGCGDGFQIADSEVTIRDTTITGSTQCRPLGCSYKATGVGILLETSIVDLYNVSILGSNGPGVSAYFSVINATGSRFVGGNVSGILMIYGQLDLVESEVAANRLWGIESLGFPIDPEELDATWGNTLADIRMNMTINVKVDDQNGKWLSHANVSAISGDVTVGPYITGFGGSTQTLELPIFEYTYGVANHSFNPWAFEVTYGEFVNTTQVDLVLGLSQITLHIAIPRADLVVDRLRVDADLDVMQETRLRATITNVGNHTVEAALLTFYYINDAGFQRVIGEVAVGPIAAGESDEGIFRWRPGETGDFTIVAFVDVDDLVDEEDEDNNRISRETSVSGEGNGVIPAAGTGLALLAVALLAILALGTRTRRRA